MISVCRREEKYPLDVTYAYEYRSVFSAMLMTDSFSQRGSYMVRSLYFDTSEDRDYFQKINEQNVRRKIRLRIYSPTDQRAKLEMKQKENIFQRKRSLTISKAEALELIGGNYSVLLRYSEDFAAELYTLMAGELYRPKSIVEYQRYAFMARENNIRLTFDGDIRATETDFNLFSEKLPLTPVFPPDKVIFDVKYDKFILEYISNLISRVDARSISSSKYCLSRSVTYPFQ